MIDLDRKEIRGITAPVIRVFIGCTIALCSTIVGAAVYIQTNFAKHELRITHIEEAQAKHERDDKDNRAELSLRFTEIDNRIYLLQEQIFKKK